MITSDVLEKKVFDKKIGRGSAISKNLSLGVRVVQKVKNHLIIVKILSIM